jgi:hypothetical protein
VDNSLPGLLDFFSAQELIARSNTEPTIQKIDFLNIRRVLKINLIMLKYNLFE